MSAEARKAAWFRMAGIAYVIKGAKEKLCCNVMGGWMIYN
jgi:hypothetical protein